METKQVIVMRTDLGMRKGKMIAQACHASMAFMSDRCRRFLIPNFSKAQEHWLTNAFTKVCVRVESEAQLLDVEQRAREAGLEVYLITDSGKTEFHGVHTKTCLAIGPDEVAKIDAITGHLTLL
jgi:PTH2 family peptidyl-tRNA hydrolase